MPSGLKIIGYDRVAAAALKKARNAASMALGKTAIGAQKAVEKEIQDVFTGPTFMVTRSVKTWISDRKAAVYISNQDYSSGPFRSDRELVTPANVLAPHVLGGGRISKNSEMALRRAGLMGDNQFIVPGKAVPLDAYGNISKGTMTKILSAVFGGQSSADWFGSSHRGRPVKKGIGAMRGVYCIPFVGIFQHTAGTGKGNRRWASAHGGPSVPLLFFTRKPPQYEQGRLDLFYVVNNFVKKNFETYMAQYMRS